MDNAIVLICLIAMLVASCWAVMVRSTLKSAVALAIVSAALSVILYDFGSVWAALFEVSVCSGFVTVIFISAVTMTSNAREEQDLLYAQREHTALLPVILILTGVVLLALVLGTHLDLPRPETAQAVNTDFRTALWVEHKGLLWAQLIVLLAGAFAVVVLFKEEKSK